MAMQPWRAISLLACRLILLCKVKFILLECCINLELDLLYHFTVVRILDDEEILSTSTIIACLEVKAATERTVCAFRADLIGYDALHVTDDVIVSIRKVHSIVCRYEARSYGFYLIEVQAEVHVAHLMAGTQESYLHRLHSILLTVLPIGCGIRADVLEFKDGHHHFLQAHATMDEVQAAALDLEPYLFSGSKALEIRPALHEIDCQQVVCLGLFICNDITAGKFHNMLF